MMPPPLLKLFSSDFGHFKINFQIFWINFLFSSVFSPFYFIFDVYQKVGGDFCNDVPPPQTFLIGFRPLWNQFSIFFSFLPVFLLILALFILFFTCTRKWGGLLQWCPPHFKKWGGQVPPVPPVSDAPEFGVSTIDTNFWFTKIKPQLKGKTL